MKATSVIKAIGQQSSRIAAIYARRSLDIKDDFSIDSQDRAMLKLASDKGCRVPPEYRFKDDGCLGGEADRPDFVKLREAIRSGVIHVAIAYDVDRLVRGLALQMLVQEEADRAGVELIYVTAPDPAKTAEQKMMMQLKGVFAEYEKHKIRERTTRGRKEKLEQGFVTSGRPAFGYRYEGKAAGCRGEWVIVPKQAKIVRRIFALAEQGRSPREIALLLDSEGIPTATGARWSKEVISAMLRNMAYSGQARFNRRAVCEPDERRRRKAPQPGKSKKTSLRLRPQSEWISVKVPVIISREEFDRVRAILDKGAALRTGRPSRQYLLSNLVKCGLCGRAAYNYPNRGRAYVRCGHFDRLTHQRICPGERLWVAGLEAAVWDALRSMIASPDELRRQIAHHDKARVAAQKNAAKQRGLLERQIFKLRQREQKAAKELMDAGSDIAASVYREDVKVTQAKRRDLERQLNALRPEALADRAAQWDLDKLCAEYAGALDHPTPEQKRAIITQWVREIRIWGGVDGGVFEMDTKLPGYMFDPNTDSWFTGGWFGATKSKSQQSAARARVGAKT